MKLTEINNKYKIPLVGEYYAGIDNCPNCGFRPKMLASNFIGFSEYANGIVCIVECPKCFTKWFFHTLMERGSASWYSQFLKLIEVDMQNFYKK